MNLENSQLDVWFVHYDEVTDSLLKEQYKKLLSEDEIVTMGKFVLSNDRLEYLVTRAALRVVLSEYNVHINPKKWFFKTNKYNKPYVANAGLDRPIYFNLSHSKNLIVLVVSRIEEIGVDVEHLRRGGSIFELAGSVFNDIEMQQMNELLGSKKRIRYFDLWTLKEAFLKAKGVGLHQPLSTFSYIFDEDDEFHLNLYDEDDEFPENWGFWRIYSSKEHAISLAIKEKSQEDSFYLNIRETIPLMYMRSVAVNAKYTNGGQKSLNAELHF